MTVKGDLKRLRGILSQVPDPTGLIAARVDHMVSRPDGSALCGEIVQVLTADGVCAAQPGLTVSTLPATCKVYCGIDLAEV